MAVQSRAIRMAARAVAAGALFLLAGCVWDQPIDAALGEQAARPARPVVVFFVDGLAPDVLARLREAGQLPNIDRYLLSRGVRVENAVSVVPSITFAANVSFITGRFPGHHGVTGNHWFDRHTLELEDYEGIGDFQRVEGDYTAATLFEMTGDLYSTTVLTPVHRGSTRHFANLISYASTWALGTREQLDALTTYRLGQIASEARALKRWPDFLFLYYATVDDVGHVHGKDSERYRHAVVHVDGEIGRACRALEQAGVLDASLLTLISDHGHAVIRPDQHVRLRDILTGRFDFKVAYRETIHGTYLQRFRRFSDDRVALCDDGNRRAVMSLRVGDDWRTRPTLAQIERFHRDYGGRAVREDPAPFWNLLLGKIKPAGRLAVVRDGDHRVLLTDGVGSAVVERQADGYDRPYRARAETFRYQVVGAPDPLGLSADPASAALVDGKFHPSEQWLRATCRGAYPDFVAQIVDYFDSPRSGDLLIFSTDGWDFSPRNLGGHGGVGRADMVVPMVFAGPGLPAGATIPTARIVDLLPTWLAFLGRPDAARDHGVIDGVSRWEELRAAGGELTPGTTAEKLKIAN